MSKLAIAYHFFLGLLVYSMHYKWDNFHFDLPVGVLSTMGIAISIFLGFRIRASYDRWWEARIIWGAIVNNSRSFAREVLTLLNADSETKKKLIHRQIAWNFLLSHHLRKTPIEESTWQLLSAEDQNAIKNARNIPNALTQLQAETLKEERDKNNLDSFYHTQLDNTLVEFTTQQGRAERIKNTPFPKEIDFIARVFIIVFTTLVPFHLVDDLAWATVPVTMIEGFIFYIIGKISRLYDNPFDNHKQDTPMTALSRTIETDLRQMLKENELPTPISPVNGFLY